jgi:hypothetical protein
MSSGVILQRSKQERMLWDLHVILDSVPEDERRREEFVRQTLRQLGVHGQVLEDAIGRVCAELPEDLDDTEMSEVLGILEKNLPIQWLEDVTSVPWALEQECKAVLLGILADRPRGTLPKAVTEQMVAMLQRVLGGYVSEGVVGRLSARIEEELISQMWRSRDHASRQELVDRLMYWVRSEAQVTFRDAY